MEEDKYFACLQHVTYAGLFTNKKTCILAGRIGSGHGELTPTGECISLF